MRKRNKCPHLWLTIHSRFVIKSVNQKYKTGTMQKWINLKYPDSSSFCVCFGFKLFTLLQRTCIMKSNGFNAFKKSRLGISLTQLRRKLISLSIIRLMNAKKSGLLNPTSISSSSYTFGTRYCDLKVCALCCETQCSKQPLWNPGSRGCSLLLQAMGQFCGAVCGKQFLFPPVPSGEATNNNTLYWMQAGTMIF